MRSLACGDASLASGGEGGGGGYEFMARFCRLEGFRARFSGALRLHCLGCLGLYAGSGALFMIWFGAFGRFQGLGL